jgi:hypothetical protein
MKDNARIDYWIEALSYAMDEAGVYALYEQMTSEQRKSAANSLWGSADNQGMAFHVPENPLHDEISRLKKSHAAELERESLRFEVLLTEACRVARIDKDRVSVSETELWVHPRG